MAALQNWFYQDIMNEAKFFSTACIAFWFAWFAPSMLQAESQGLVINEVMASNATTIADEDGDYEDWIELYNSGNESVNLFGWGLSDDYDNPFRWVFPNVSVQPGEFLLIWASGKNRSQPGQPLHTNFSISMAGEEVLITRPDGTRQDELAPIMIPTDFSYGRKPDGANAWYYFSEPTPGTANVTNGYNGFSTPPEILIEHVQDRTFYVEINHNDSDAIIYYTTDCSDPGEHSLVYNEPFHLQAPPDSLMFIRTNPVEADQNGFGWLAPVGDFAPAVVIRATAMQDSLIASPQATNTGIAATYDLPVVSVSSDVANLFSDSIGIYVPGDIYNTYGWNHDDWWGRPNANYHQRGDEWERPGNFEIIYPDSTHLSQGVGLRIHGGGTRAQPLKSFRLYARNRYGADTITTDVLSNQPEAYKRLIIRNSGQDYMNTMFRDAAIQAIFEDFNFDTQAYAPAICFVNGEYWGIINIRERYDKHYLERVYGIDPDNIDYLTGANVAKEGDNLHYIATLNYIQEYGLYSDAHYNYIKTRIDLENFIDYQIANIYANNTDWPGNNIDFWRLRTNGYNPNSEYGHDGRWRWLLYDTDFGFGLREGSSAYHLNTLVFATEEYGPSWPNPPWSTFMLRSFLQNQEFRHAFINRFADQLNTALSPERTESVILDMKHRINDEIEDHFARWGHNNAYTQWLNNVNVMLSFANNRPYHQRKHIEGFFDLDGQISVQIDTENLLKGYARINTINIRPETVGVAENPYPWTGTYFKHVPVEIEAVPMPGYEFSHWEGSSNSSSPIISFDSTEDLSVTAFFSVTDSEMLIHYWHFDTSMPNDTPLETLSPRYSIIPDGPEIEYVSSFEGYPFYPDHPFWRKASMERRNQPTAINYRPEGNNNIPYNNSSMRGLQIRQPFVNENRENTMILYVPTTGFSNIVLRLAAKDEGAADYLVVDYAVDKTDNSFTDTGLSETIFPLDAWYNLYEIDFSDIEEVANNPGFRVRIRFGGDNLLQDDGNRVTFNNISLDGLVLDAFNIYASAGNNGSINPSGIVPVYQHDNPVFTIVPNKNHKIADVFVDDQSVLDKLTMYGDTAVFSFTDVQSDHRIHADFMFNPALLNDDDGLIIYPNPATEIVNIVSSDTINALRISNMSGRLMLSLNKLNTKELTVNVGHLSNGFYLLTVYTKNRKSAKKLLILR